MVDVEIEYYGSRIQAHRGGGVFAPENTLAALRTGLAMGFRAVEFDVMLTSDAQLVLMHDCVLGRTTFPPATSAATISEAFSYAYLQTLDAGSWFTSTPTSASVAFVGERIPLFADVVKFCSANRITMNVEIKPCPGYEAITGEAIAHLLAEEVRTGCTSTLPLVSSFSAQSLSAARQACPAIPRALLISGPIPSDWRDRLEHVAAVALHVDFKHLTEEVCHDVKASGFRVFCYTVNDAAVAKQLFAWGVDAICTDRLDIVNYRTVFDTA